MVGIPDGYTRLIALPDQEPVEFPYTKAVRASWITDDLVQELLEYEACPGG